MPRLLLPALLLLALFQPAAADIRILAVGPMTGVYAPLGSQIRAGVQRAADDLNAAGGLNGERISVDIEDDACKADAATAAANRAVGRGDVLAIGHVCAETANAAAPVYQAAGVLFISPAVTANVFTDKRVGALVFRLAARDDSQPQIDGQYLADHFARQRIAILGDGSPYGKALADGTRQAMNLAGKREARAESYDPGAKDYSALADRLNQDSIDVAFIGGYQGDIALIAKAMRAAGSQAVLIGGDALATTEYPNSAGDAAEGTLFSFYRDDRANPAASNVATAFRASGTEPEGFVLPSYAAVQAWAAARQSAGNNPVDIAARLEAGTVPTVLGAIGFDAKGDVELPGFSLYRWQGGRVVPAP